ncbi:hypothetical protein I3271_05370 [Photobacterium leiognathi]|uniref:hypothetical protein n=1 Tax=Photobacterium leiognathi TaxID=553611 RepID=UPI001EDFE911|nr:hypothetical protein [Photobacterium leiognathi]MCG3884110.1 hypothetical protein [Photobacterium leiognathi]
MTLHYGLLSREQALKTAVAVNNAISPKSGKWGVCIILETACAETLLGKLKDPTEYGAGSSICQIDKGTFEWLKDKYKGKAVDKRINDAFGFDLADIQYREIELNPLLGMIWCRLRYMTVSDPIPTTIGGRAKYWKEHYNTKLGKGTESDYITKSNNCDVVSLIQQI